MADVTADQAVNEFKAALISAVDNSIWAVLIGDFPIFNAPVLKQLAQYAINYVISTAVRYTELGAYTLYVNAYVGQEKIDFENAVTSGDEQKIIEAARKFIKFGA